MNLILWWRLFWQHCSDCSSWLQRQFAICLEEIKSHLLDWIELSYQSTEFSLSFILWIRVAVPGPDSATCFQVLPESRIALLLSEITCRELSCGVALWKLGGWLLKTVAAVSVTSVEIPWGEVEVFSQPRTLSLCCHETHHRGTWAQDWAVCCFAVFSFACLSFLSPFFCSSSLCSLWGSDCMSTKEKIYLEKWKLCKYHVVKQCRLTPECTVVTPGEVTGLCSSLGSQHLGHVPLPLPGADLHIMPCANSFQLWKTYIKQSTFVCLTGHISQSF